MSAFLSTVSPPRFLLLLLHLRPCFHNLRFFSLFFFFPPLPPVSCTCHEEGERERRKGSQASRSQPASQPTTSFSPLYNLPSLFSSCPLLFSPAPFFFHAWPARRTDPEDYSQGRLSIRPSSSPFLRFRTLVLFHSFSTGEIYSPPSCYNRSCFPVSFLIFYSDVIGVPLSLLTRKPSFWFDRWVVDVDRASQPEIRWNIERWETKDFLLSIEVSFLKGRKSFKFDALI